MRLNDNLKYKYLRFFGVLCIIFGVLSGYDAFQLISNPAATVVINGVERSDAEAKLMSFFLPVIFIAVGVVLNLVTRNDVANIRRAENTLWSIFRK
ncbi:hypothetical protein PA25_22410 [Pseudoalteromonas sp. A25]|nr:hypothetical protein PA25_22410 [Pseudoalteromonas sp. A25]